MRWPTDLRICQRRRPEAFAIFVIVAFVAGKLGQHARRRYQHQRWKGWVAPATTCERDFSECAEYLNRTLEGSAQPTHKLNAFVISNPRYPKNMKYVDSEWGKFVNVKMTVFVEAENRGATLSHSKLLLEVWRHRNEPSFFPVVLMEDDVYRRGAFTAFWNELPSLDECDYVAFDPMFLKFSPQTPALRHAQFLAVTQHNGAGFIVWYRHFFTRWPTEQALLDAIGDTMDLHLTHSPDIVHCTPRRQVCRQIVNKKSTTANMGNDQTLSYQTWYEEAARAVLAQASGANKTTEVGAPQGF